MLKRVSALLTIVCVLFFSSAQADSSLSLSDALTSICKAPLCVDHSGNKAIISTDGTPLAVKDWAPYNSNKPTFLFIHGFPHGQGLWTSQILSQLLQNYRLVTMDIRGGGGSGVPNLGSYEQLNFGDDIEAIINTLGLKNVILVAHSYGGILVNAYVVTHGLSKIKGIVFVAAAANLANADIPQPIHDLVVQMLSPDTTAQATIDFVAASHYKPFPQYLTNAVVNMDNEVPLNGRLGQITSAFGNSDGTAIVKTINVPVLIIQGQKDGIVLPSTSDRLQSNLTSSPKVTRLNLANTGHFSPLESPSDFNNAIDNFAKSLKIK